MENIKVERYGVKMTKIEAMEFDKWMSNNNYAMNMLTECERKDHTQDILKLIRTKKINNFALNNALFWDSNSSLWK